MNKYSFIVAKVTIFIIPIFLLSQLYSCLSSEVSLRTRKEVVEATYKKPVDAKLLEQLEDAAVNANRDVRALAIEELSSKISRKQEILDFLILRVSEETDFNVAIHAIYGLKKYFLSHLNEKDYNSRRYGKKPTSKNDEVVEDKITFQNDIEKYINALSTLTDTQNDENVQLASFRTLKAIKDTLVLQDKKNKS